MLATKQPKFFVAENVRGILSLGKGLVIKKIIRDFENTGYIVSVHKVNMADYGVPQNRIRVILIGQHRDLGLPPLYDFPCPTHNAEGTEGLQKWRSIQSAIGHFPNPDTPNAIPNHIYSTYKLAFRDFTGHSQPIPTSQALLSWPGAMAAAVFVRFLITTENAA